MTSVNITASDQNKPANPSESSQNPQQNPQQNQQSGQQANQPNKDKPAQQK